MSYLSRCVGRLLLWGLAGLGFLVLSLGGLRLTGHLPLLPASFLPARLAPGDTIPLAIIDMSQVKTEAVPFKRLHDAMTQAYKELEDEFHAHEKRLRTENDEIKRIEATGQASREALTTRKTELQAHLAAVSQAARQKKEAIDGDVQRALTQIEERLKTIIEDTAVRHGSQIVIEAASVLFADSVDLTNEIIQRLDADPADIPLPHSPHNAPPTP